MTRYPLPHGSNPTPADHARTHIVVRMRGCHDLDRDPWGPPGAGGGAGGLPGHSKNFRPHPVSAAGPGTLARL